MATFPSVLQLEDLDGSNGFTFTASGSLQNSFLGFAVADIGDINNDGIDDVAIGASNVTPGTDRSTLNAGATFVIFGSSSGFTADLDPSSLDGSNGFVVEGVGVADFIGAAVSSAGDINNDGIDDFAIGAPSFDFGNRFDAGRSYVVFGRSAGFETRFSVADIDGSNGFTIDGIGRPGELIFSDQSGSSISSAGDVNGDGIDDLILSAPLADGVDNSEGEVGESYVLFGRSGGFGTNLQLSDLNGSNGFKITGIDEDDFSGSTVSGAGDINGDGFSDLLIGAPGAEQDTRLNVGESYVVFGKGTGFAANLNLADLDGSNGFVLKGIDAFDGAGTSVSGVGDVNGDGLDDILIGAPEADPGGLSGNLAGESYVVYGSRASFGAELELASLDGRNGFVINGNVSVGQSGEAVSGAGDVNGDGIADLLIGAPSVGTPGEIYVVFGRVGGFGPSLEIADLNGSNGFTIDGALGDDSAGISVSSAGDVNADGIDDIAIGSSFFSLNENRRSYIVFGQGEGVVTPDTPLVTISASDAEAGEPDDDGGFTVTRTGATTETLTVTLTVGGTAEGGVDYEAIATTLTIPAGADAAEIPVSVVDDTLVEGTETVTVTLADDDAYDLGEDITASVNITSEDTDTPSEFNFIIGTPGVNPLFGGEERDFIIGTEEANEIFANGNDDIILGDPDNTAGGDDTIFADVGNDLVLAGLGNDLVFGGEGNDTIFGGGGDDLIFGGGGNDILFGNAPVGEAAEAEAGQDIFAVGSDEGTDIVADFEVGIDAIALLNNLSFEQLYIVQSNQDTVIGAFSDSEPLAILLNVNAESLTPEAFLSFA